MANLVKISNVALYANFDDIDVFTCKSILDNNYIPHQLLVYTDKASLPSLFAALSTWSFGPNFTQYNLTKMPIIVWTEFYDDYERYANIALNSVDLQNSNLLANANLIVGYVGSNVIQNQAVFEGYIDNGIGDGNYNGQVGLVLTVTNMISGTIEEGMSLSGSGIITNIAIASFGQQGTTGTGETGTYYIVGKGSNSAPTMITGTK